eukprot:469331-Pelagomonas_calceolata.AAC.1
MMGHKRERVPFGSMVFRPNNEGICFPPNLLRSVPQIPQNPAWESWKHSALFVKRSYDILIAHATKCLRHMCRPTGLVPTSKYPVEQLDSSPLPMKVQRLLATLSQYWP